MFSILTVSACENFLLTLVDMEIYKTLIYICLFLLTMSILQLPVDATLPGPQFSLPASVRLHVYESVELELSLLPDDQGFTTPLHLHPDPSTPTR